MFNRLSLLLLASTLFVQQAPAKPHCKDPAQRNSFTNLATRLLQSELDLAYGRLQIYPTNQYTHAVHRLLQVSANIHEAAKEAVSFESNTLPSVFKPVLLKQADAIVIVGYEEIEGDARPLLTAPLNLQDPTQRAALDPSDNVFGMPWIIGARKGL